MLIEPLVWIVLAQVPTRGGEKGRHCIALP